MRSPAARPDALTARQIANRARRARLLASFAFAVLAICTASAAAAAHTTAPIERVWSFNGGEVAIQAQPNGSYAGTVIAPTSFAQCVHPVGEAMWTNMVAQPDGSFWGFHHWFFETVPCTPEEQLGPTAWRVMTTAAGDSYLLVCFGDPGGTQPMIATDGVPENVGYGCDHSAEIAPIAAPQSFASAVTVPSSQRCVSRRDFKIHLHQARYDPFKEVVVTLASRRVVVKRHGNVFAATIDLRGLPRGAFTVRIRITTVLGHRISGRRTFHTCVASTAGKTSTPRSKARKR